MITVLAKERKSCAPLLFSILFFNVVEEYNSNHSYAMISEKHHSLQLTLARILDQKSILPRPNKHLTMNHNQHTCCYSQVSPDVL